MIAGVATVTIVVSTRIMKKPRHSAKSAGQGLTSAGIGSRVEVCEAMTEENTFPRTLIPRDRWYVCGDDGSRRPGVTRRDRVAA